MIDRETIDRIYAAANIVDIIGEYVTLKRKGVNYQACCPFHNEKTPSFVVSPSKGVYKCFGCGKGGKAVTFLIEHENMTYPEAMKAVAKRYGIEVREKEMTPEEVARWREAVSACVPALIAAWEPIMGVRAGKVAYRNMTSRWGSCQPSTGRICINVRLALYPPECLEYVVVHELCHLLECGHGPRFHQLMDAFMPDWKQRRAKLR